MNPMSHGKRDHCESRAAVNLTYLPMIPDLRHVLVHVRAEVAQADQRLAAGVLDLDAGRRPPRA